MVERALGESQRLLGSGGELARNLQRAVHQLVGRHAETDQADALGLLAVDEIGGQQVVLRACAIPHSSGQMMTA